MGLNAKDIQVFIWGILRVSIITCYRCVRKYPLVSGVLLFFLLLYKLFPTVFIFLIYSSPIIVCTAVFIRIYFRSKGTKIQNIKEYENRNIEISPLKSELAAANLLVNRNNNVSTQSRRRNVKEKNKDGDAQGGKEEKDMVFSTTRDDDLIGRTTLFEGQLRAIIEGKEGHSLDHGKSSSHKASVAEIIQAPNEQCSVVDAEPSKPDLSSHNCSDKQSDNSNADSSEESEDDDEEEAQEDGNKAVEWTEDDEKNLVDLGISEIERNRRLESLIANRRASKLFRKQVEKSLIDMDSIPPRQVAPIFISRSSPFDLPNNPDVTEGFLMPGSAPSVLLPGRNPFDIPYDPYEEKPNLVGDSFHQEFMAAHQKEISFCRHESFTLGPFFPGEPKQDWNNTKSSPLFVNEKRALEGPRYSRLRRQQSDHDQRVEQLLSQEGEAIFDIDNATNLVEDRRQAPDQVINSMEFMHEENRETNNCKTEIKGEIMEKSHGMETRSGDRSKVLMEPDLIKDNTSYSSEENEQVFNANRAEVSENVRPTESKFPEELSVAVQKSLTCSVPEGMAVNDPLYDSSPSANDKTRSEECFFYTNGGSYHTPNYSIASDLQVEVSEVGSPRMTVDGTISSVDGESFTYEGEVEKEITSGSNEMWGASCHLSGVEENESRTRAAYEVSEEDIVEVGFSGLEKNSSDTVASSMQPEEVKQVVEDTEEPRSSITSEALSPGNQGKSQNVMEILVAHLPHEVDSVKPEEPSYPPEKPTEEVNIIYDMSVPIIQENDEMEDLKSIEVSDGGTQILIKQDLAGYLAKPAEISNEYLEGNSVKLTEHQTINEAIRLVEEDDNLKSVEFGGTLEKITETEGITGTSKPSEDKEQLNLIEDGKVYHQSIGEIRISVHQSFDDPIASAAQPELVVEDVPINASSSSSPKSVLLQNAVMGQVSSLNCDQEMHVDVPEPDVENMVKNNSVVEHQPKETLTMPQNTSNLVEGFIANSTIYSDFEKFQEPSNSTGWSAEEANIIYNVIQPAVDDKEEKENLESIEARGGKSVTLFGCETSELSKAAEEANSRVMECVSEKLTEYEASIGASKPAKESINSNIPETMKPTSPPGRSTEEANIINGVNDLVIRERQDKDKLSVEGSEGESESLIRQEAVLEPPPPKPAEVNNSRFNEDSNGEFKNSSEDEVVIGPSKLIKENESATIKDTEDFELIEHEDAIHPPVTNGNEGRSEATKNLQGGSETWVEHEVVVDTSKPAIASDNFNIPVNAVGGEEPFDPHLQKFNVEVAEVTNSGSIQDIMGKSEVFTEDEAIVGSSNPAEERNNSKDMRHTEESRKLIDHENVINPPMPGEGNIEMHRSP